MRNIASPVWPWLARAAVPLAALGLYLYTAYPEPGWIDSGLLGACSHLLDIPHPTAKQLYMLLSRAALIVLPGQFWPLTFFSALAVAWTVWLTGAFEFEADSRRRIATPLLVGAALATAPLLWQQATINEVHALQLFLFAAFLWFWWHPRDRGRVAMLFYLAALAFANHGTAIFLEPFLIEVLWRERRTRSIWFTAGGFTLAGLSLYLYFPIRSFAGTLLDWDATAHWGGFMRHFTGWQYGVWFGSEGTPEFLDRLSQFGWYLWDNLPWALLPISAYGLVVLARRSWARAATMGVAFLTCVIVSCSYGIPDIEPYFLLAILLAVLWLGFGLSDLMRRPFQLGVVAVLCVIASLAVRLPSRFERSNTHDFHVATDWIRDASQTLEPGSIVLTHYWDHYSPWFYLRHVEGFRPDVLWLDVRLVARSWYPAYIRRVAPERYAGAEAALSRLAPLVARFESGQPYDSMALQQAYRAAVFALSLGQPGPVYVDALAPPSSDWGDPVHYLGGAPLAPRGLLLRALRPNEEVAPLSKWPDYRNWNVTGSVTEATAYQLDLYDRAFEAWRTTQ